MRITSGAESRKCYLISQPANLLKYPLSSFIDDDPGRQTLTGSFNPIDVGEWAAQVYIGPTEKLFAAIAAKDRAKVAEITREGFDFSRRDHVGRTALHVAIISHANDIACDLIEAGARITARLADGRNCLHLASQFDQLVVIRRLLDQSAVNEEKEKEKEKDAAKTGKGKDKKADAGLKDIEMSDSEDIGRASSEDDWSSEEESMEVDGEDKEVEEGDDNEEDDDAEMGSDAGSDKSSADAPPETVAGGGDIPEDEEDTPDVLDIDQTDWDLEFTALSYAVLFGSLQVIEALLTAGADTKTPHKAGSAFYHPLSLTLLIEHDDRAAKVAERLIRAGASSSTADNEMKTIFHLFVAAQRPKLVSALLRADPNAVAVLDHPAVQWGQIIFPLVTAIEKCDYATIAILLAYGSKVNYSEEEISRVAKNNNK